MSLILPAVNIQHFLSSRFVKHLTIVRCSEIYSLEVQWMNIFQVIYSPPFPPFPPLVVLPMVIVILSVFEVSRVSCVFWFYWVSLVFSCFRPIVFHHHYKIPCFPEQQPFLASSPPLTEIFKIIASLELSPPSHQYRYP